MSITRLTAYLNVNYANFEAGLKKAAQSMGSFGSVLKTGAQAAGLALVGVGAALTALTLKQANYIDETNKLANSLGINVRELQALALVADEAGVEQDALAKAVQRTQTAIVEAENGTQSYVDTFARLGLKTSEIINLSPEQQFLKIGEALNKIENPTQRTALALEIFGKQGRSIIGMLPELSAKIDEARAFNDRFGLSLNSIDAAKVEIANDTFARVGKVIDGLGTVLAVNFAPAVTAVSNAFIESGFSAVSFGKSVRDGILVAARIIDNFRVSFMGLKVLILELGKSIDLFVVDASKSLFNLAKATREIFTPWESGPSAGENLFLNINQNAVSSAKRNISAIEKAKTEAGEFKYLYDEIKKSQKETENLAIKNAAGNKKVTEAAKSIAAETEKATTSARKLNTATERTKQTLDSVKTASASAFGSMQTDITSAVGELSSFGKIALDVLNMIAGAFSQKYFGGSGAGGINELASGALSSVVGSLFGINSAPSFATGSRYIPRDMMARVHRGEMITPANQMDGGGSGVSVNITNNVQGARVNTQPSANGKSIDIMIDEAVARNINTPGSKTYGSIRRFGSAPLSKG